MVFGKVPRIATFSHLGIFEAFIILICLKSCVKFYERLFLEQAKEMSDDDIVRSYGISLFFRNCLRFSNTNDHLLEVLFCPASLNKQNYYYYSIRDERMVSSSKKRLLEAAKRKGF